MCWCYLPGAILSGFGTILVFGMSDGTFGGWSTPKLFSTPWLSVAFPFSPWETTAFWKKDGGGELSLKAKWNSAWHLWRLKVHSWHWERQLKPRHKVHLVAFSGAFHYLSSARKKENWTSTFSWQRNAKDWLINYSFQCSDAFRCIELKWKMWFAWFLVEPNIPLFNALICGLKAVNKPQVYKFSSNNKNQRNCLCVHSSFYIRDIVLWAARNVLWPEHPADIPLKDIYDDLLQDFLRKCWQLETKSLHCPEQ